LNIPVSREGLINGGTVLPNGTIQYATGALYDLGEFTCMDKVMVVQEIVYQDEVRNVHCVKVDRITFGKVIALVKLSKVKLIQVVLPL
jgi:hypothetical protein